MDETKIRIHNFFQLLKEEFFSSVDIDNVINMTEKQQQDFLLEQVERMLDGDVKTSDAARLSGYFWTSKEGRNRNAKAENPLMEPKSREVMDDDERLLCSFYLTLAGFCHDVVYHFSFDPMALGLSAPEEFYVDNDELVKFALNTKYRRIAAHVVCIMRIQALQAMDEADYRVAYDFLRKVWYEEGGVFVKEPGDHDIPASDYVRIVIEALNRIEKHLRDGLGKKIPQNVIFVHDELFGKFMDTYDAVALAAAREINNYIEHTTYVKSTGQVSGKHEGKQLSSKERFLKRFYDKLSEIRAGMDRPELFGDVAMKYLAKRIEKKFFEEE